MSQEKPSNSELPALPQRRPDRKISIMHRFVFGLTLALLSYFRILGVDRASAHLGKFLRVVGPRLRSISKRAEANLRHVYPDWDEAKIKKTTADVWENLGRTAAEYAHLDKFRVDGPEPRIFVENLSAFADEDRTQVIFVTGHFANWEVSAICANQLGIKLGIIYRATNNPLIDEMIIKKRAVASTPFQAPKGARGALALLDFLKRGLSIAILADQKLGEGMSVPFMGRDAMTPTSAARMALKYKMPIIPVTTERLKGARFRVTAHDTIHVDPSAETRGEIYRITKKINEALEQQINACPGQWLWLHRRWGKDVVAPPVAERNV